MVEVEEVESHLDLHNFLLADVGSDPAVHLEYLAHLNSSYILNLTAIFQHFHLRPPKDSKVKSGREAGRGGGSEGWGGWG